MPFSPSQPYVHSYCAVVAVSVCDVRALSVPCIHGCGMAKTAVARAHAGFMQESVVELACDSVGPCGFMHGQKAFTSNWRQLNGNDYHKKKKKKKEKRERRRDMMMVRASNDRGGGGGGGRTVFNLAMAGLLTYLTVSGKLADLFEVIVSISVFLLIAAWFTERQIIKGPCPNCGNEFQVLESSLQQESRLCPFCSEPFRLENRQFLREAPHFSSHDFGFSQPADNLGKNPPSEQVVDIEAEVRDKE